MAEALRAGEKVGKQNACQRPALSEAGSIATVQALHHHVRPVAGCGSQSAAVPGHVLLSSLLLPSAALS
jgi:hypothetical protein